MTNRDRAIKQAFEDGYKHGQTSSDRRRHDHTVARPAEQYFWDWAEENAHLLDGVPDLESRVRELEAKLDQADNYAREQQERS